MKYLLIITVFLAGCATSSEYEATPEIKISSNKRTYFKNRCSFIFRGSWQLDLGELSVKQGFRLVEDAPYFTEIASFRDRSANSIRDSFAAFFGILPLQDSKVLKGFPQSQIDCKNLSKWDLRRLKSTLKKEFTGMSTDALAPGIHDLKFRDAFKSEVNGYQAIKFILSMYDSKTRKEWESHYFLIPISGERITGFYITFPPEPYNKPGHYAYAYLKKTLEIYE